MKVLHTKALSGDIIAIALCPTMDLLAVATATSVYLHRSTTLARLFVLSSEK